MRISIESAITKVSFLLQKNGLSETDAMTVAECLVNSDAYGISSHGLTVLPAHLERIRTGGYKLCPKYQVISSTAAYSIIDADNGIGYASAAWCMDLAIRQAEAVGIHTVFCRNANTYGAAFLYPLMAAKKGYIGFTCCNSPAAMAPIGGKTKLFGTNPFSIAIPNGDEPMILDMATSKVAKSRFLQEKKKGSTLPEGWAMDKNGVPTTDPDEAIQGLVCPMEGYKGYGMALMIDFLAGFLSGAAYQDQIGRFYNAEGKAMNVGQVFIAINPKMIFGEQFEMMTRSYAEHIRSSTPISENESIAVPGDLNHEAYRKALSEGIEVPETILNLSVGAQI